MSLCLKLCIRIPLSVMYKKSQRLYYKWSCFISPFRSLPTSMIYPLVVRAPVGLSGNLPVPHLSQPFLHHLVSHAVLKHVRAIL